jgi:hypothetical protein
VVVTSRGGSRTVHLVVAWADASGAPRLVAGDLTRDQGVAGWGMSVAATPKVLWGDVGTDNVYFARSRNGTGYFGGADGLHELIDNGTMLNSTSVAMQPSAVNAVAGPGMLASSDPLIISGALQLGAYRPGTPGVSTVESPATAAAPVPGGGMVRAVPMPPSGQSALRLVNAAGVTEASSIATTAPSVTSIAVLPDAVSWIHDAPGGAQHLAVAPLPPSNQPPTTEVEVPPGAYVVAGRFNGQPQFFVIPPEIGVPHVFARCFIRVGDHPVLCR